MSVHLREPKGEGQVLKTSRTIKILFLAANPLDTTRLRLDEEIRAIDQALRLAEFRDKFDIRQHWAVRVSDLQGLLLRYKPDIVHFSGHGGEASEIILEDSHGESHPVPVRALSSLFSVLKDDIRCVVLNACYSEKQAQAIAGHIDYVIGMSKAIRDKAAISFAAAFYQALGYGKDVETAFDLGCVQIDLENLGERDTPKLLTTIRYQGNALLVRQTETEIVAENIYDSPVAIRISWDGDDPHGIGSGTDSFIDNYVVLKGHISRKLKNRTSVQVWAWGTSGALVDSCSFSID